MTPLIMQLMLAGSLLFSPQTADDQSNKKPDVEVTQAIRKEITKAPGMSTNAKNIKIITKDGTVTLRGHVKTADERSQIEEIAKKSAASNKVVNELEVVK